MTHVSTAVGLILSAHGTLRLFRNERGRLYVEVVGFTSDKGQRFLEDLAEQLEDILSEVLVHDDAAFLGDIPLEPARLHRRRSA